MSDTLNPPIIPDIVPAPIENERDRLPDDQETNPHFGNDDDGVEQKKSRDGEPEQLKPF
jgi:hypothetical protein